MLKIKPMLEWKIITGTGGTSGECLLSPPAGDPSLVALAFHQERPFGTKMSPLMFEQKGDFSRAGAKAFSPRILVLVRECGTGPAGVLFSRGGEKGEREVSRCWKRRLHGGCSRTK